MLGAVLVVLMTNTPMMRGAEENVKILYQIPILLVWGLRKRKNVLVAWRDIAALAVLVIPTLAVLTVILKGKDVFVQT
tara:strand:+ start:225 stop:458 length:234 start_codon:yes stop_codon:yes gene_type:complete